jgi:hypothetical protein
VSGVLSGLTGRIGRPWSAYARAQARASLMMWSLLLLPNRSRQRVVAPDALTLAI